MTIEIPNGMRIHHEVLQLAESMLLSEAYFQFPGSTVIVCLLTTHHGHHEIGSSYYLDPEEFDDELGRANARADAMKYLYQVAHYLHREKQFNDGAVLEPAVPVPDIQNVGMGYMITGVPSDPITMANVVTLSKNRPGDITFVETGPDLEAIEAAMKDVTEADIAEVITRMHAAVVANREAKEADAQLAGEIEQTKAQTEGAGAEHIAETAAQLQAAGLATAAEVARLQEDATHFSSAPTFMHRERDSQVSGDGVELLSVQHPSSASVLEYMSLSDLKRDGGSE